MGLKTDPKDATEPAAKEAKEEGPRSFIKFLSDIAGGEVEREASYQLHELGKRLQEEALTRNTSVKPAGGSALPRVAGLWIDGPLPGLNEIIDAAKGAGGVGKHYARLKRQWQTTVWALALQAGIQKPGPFVRPVVLTFEWMERDRRRDPDNIAAGGRKLILDGLVQAKVLKGDGWKHVESWSDRFRVLPDRPGVAVTIFEMDATVQMGGAS